jgi:hypothetical protein
MKLLIGCPIYKRDWILNHWIRCLINQSFDSRDIGFIFEVSPDDTSTISMLEAWKKFDKNIPYFEIKMRNDIPHFQHENNGRQWTISKYQNMVSLRNSILSTVREVEPEYYFSLDSDILLTNPNTIEMLIAHIKEGADAVSPLMFMTPIGDMYPSVMSWRTDVIGKAFRLRRYPLNSYFKSDVIMAAKMMSKKVYQNVDYTIHEQGEDVGWSWECAKLNYKLFSAAYIYAPHIMSIEMYKEYLKNGDNRLEQYQLV